MRTNTHTLADGEIVKLPAALAVCQNPAKGSHYVGVTEGSYACPAYAVAFKHKARRDHVDGLLAEAERFDERGLDNFADQNRWYAERTTKADAIVIAEALANPPECTC